MNRFVVITTSIMAGCTVTVTPLPKTHKKIQHTVKHHKKESAEPVPSLIVDHDWYAQYRALEKEHNYRIPDDAKVETVGGGKYKVTRSMLRHFNALSQAPSPETPTPAPSP